MSFPLDEEFGPMVGLPEDSEAFVAKCLRDTADFMGSIAADNRFKFDFPNGFDLSYVRQWLNPNVPADEHALFQSPKTLVLLENIRRLDEEDMQIYGQLQKHYIYAEDSQIARFLVGALLAGLGSEESPMAVVHRPGTLEMRSNDELENTPNRNIAYLLSSSLMNGAAHMGAGNFDEMKKLFNSRPANSTGRLARFIVLDGKFKEGVDLFDVRHAHLFDPHPSRSYLKQVIGRATRLCGQQGLDFDKERGWPLDVYLYDMTVPYKTVQAQLWTPNTAVKPTVGDLYRYLKMNTDETDAMYISFEAAARYAAVDRSLNTYVNEFATPYSRKLEKQLMRIQMPIPASEQDEEEEEPVAITMDFVRVPELEEKFADKKPKPAISQQIAGDLPGLEMRRMMAELQASITIRQESIPIPQSRPLTRRMAAKYGLQPAAAEKHIPVIRLGKDIRCGTRKTKDVQVTTVELILLVHVLHQVDQRLNYLGELDKPLREARLWLCDKLRTDGKFGTALLGLFDQLEAERASSPEKAIQSLLVDRALYFEEFARALLNTSDQQLFSIENYTPYARRSIAKYIYVALGKALPKITRIGKKEIPKPALPSSPFTSVSEMNFFVDTNLGHLKWPKPRMQSQCRQVESKILSPYTPTQQFMTNYFRPDSPYKGILAWHSVGTGKTGLALSTASENFVPAGYKVIWVTRGKIIDEIAKNAFGVNNQPIFLHQLRKDIRQNANPEVTEMVHSLATITDKEERKRIINSLWSRYLPSSQWQFMSYRTFTNFLSGENEVGRRTATAVGSRGDMLKNTLVIVDEAHKLYENGDMIEQERPDTEALEKAIYRSYRQSATNSVRLLLLTATPYGERPMLLMKLLNLLRDENEHLPEDEEDFAEQYDMDNGRFSTTGFKRFADDIAGYVSYLDRTRDGRQFALPVIRNVMIDFQIKDDEEDINDAEEMRYLPRRQIEDKDSSYVQEILRQECGNAPTENCQKKFEKKIKDRKQELKRLRAGFGARFAKTHLGGMYKKCIVGAKAKKDMPEETQQP